MPDLTRRAALAGLAALTAFPARASSTSITRMITGLSEPWAFGFLPGGGVLVTERAGTLSLHQGDKRQNIGGVPQVYAQGQGGLLDICISRDFARSRRIHLTYAAPQGGGGAGTALASARLSAGGDALEDVRVLYQVAPGGRGGRHFGARVVELRDGTLALTLGDRGSDALAQDKARAEGKILRLSPDGSVPRDNPFQGQPGVLPEIWSLGHRNPQGAALDAAGQLWASEHGARGGDEINRISPGTNYGWPVISYGRHYSGLKIGRGTESPGMAQPAHYWDPSIAPSGHVIHSGKMFTQFRGEHLIGSLNSDHIARLNPGAQGPGGWAQERLEMPETGRVRDIREAPDGAVWFASVHQGALFRLSRS